MIDALATALAPLEAGRFTTLRPYDPQFALDGLGVLGLVPVAISMPGTFFALYPVPSTPPTSWPLVAGGEVLGGDLTRASSGIARLPVAWLLDLRCKFAPSIPEALDDYEADAGALAAWGEELGDGGAAEALVAELPRGREIDPAAEPPAYRYGDEVVRAYWELSSHGPFGGRFPVMETYLDELRAIYERDRSYAPPLYEELQWAAQSDERRATACALEVLRSDLAVNGVGLLEALQGGAGDSWIVARAGALLASRKDVEPRAARLARAASELDFETMHATYLEMARAEGDAFRAYVLARNAAYLFTLGTSSAPREAWSEALRYAAAVGDPVFAEAVASIPLAT